MTLTSVAHMESLQCPNGWKSPGVSEPGIGTFGSDGLCSSHWAQALAKLKEMLMQYAYSPNSCIFVERPLKYTEKN